MDIDVIRVFFGALIAQSNPYLRFGLGRLPPPHKRIQRRLIGLRLIERRLLLGRYLLRRRRGGGRIGTR